jgi:hypothetical protein
MQLAGEIVTFLNSSITTTGAPTFGIQFGAYNTFLSFFGMADLPAANPNFMGIPDYASSMVLEVFGSNASTNPNPADLSVRFLFSNGSTGIYGDPTPYPLFGGSDLVLSWNEFSSKMMAFGIDSTQQWCQICGNSTGVCVGSTEGSSSSTPRSGGHHISNAVAGIIGAMVTLAVVLGLEALVAFVAGLRVVRKNRSRSPGEKEEVSVSTKADSQ